MSQIVRLSCAMLMMAIFVVTMPARAGAQDAHHSDQAAPSAPGGGASGQRQGMMGQDMMKMMGDMKAADAKLDALVQAMNAAKGADRIDAIAAVVTALVEQHHAMRNSMGMMGNMMAGQGAKEQQPGAPKQ